MNKLREFRVKAIPNKDEIARRKGCAPYHPGRKLSDRQIKSVKAKHGTGTVSQQALASKYGVNASTIAKYLKGGPNAKKPDAIGITQGELAVRAGVSQVTISFIEGQYSDPMEITKARLAEALGVPVLDLFPCDVTCPACGLGQVRKEKKR